MDDNHPASLPDDNLHSSSNSAVSATSTSSPVAIEAMHRQRSWEWLRRFFACNPFYLISAALLLYSFYLVSSDHNFLPTEVGQLSFNLSSLQLYQIVLVITAILLARREIWYDSTLLVGLENLLLLVPFILVSQAALIDARLVWALCLAAGLLAGARLGLLRRFITKLDFPPRLAGIGLFVLAVNAVLPDVYRVLHESKFGTRPDWGAAYETNQYVWWLVVPVLCALLWVLPWSRAAAGDSWPQRPWLPSGLFCLWLVGTGVHLYCLGYVYDFGLRPELLAPAVWILAWMAYLKVEQCVPGLKESWKNAFCALPVAATLLATPQPEKAVFLGLTVLNASFFVWAYVNRRAPIALHFALISLAAIFAWLPDEWGRALTTQFSRETFMGGAGVAYFLICVGLSRDPKLGVLGGLAAAISVSLLAQQLDTLNWAVQTGLVFLLLHSMRWIDARQPGAGLLRWLAAAAWIAHSLAWTHLYGAGWEVCLVAIPVIGAWVLLRWLHGKWERIAIPLAALIVALSAPGHAAAVHLESAPAGLIAVVGSFILFGLGTLGALTKHRWLSH